MILPREHETPFNKAPLIRAVAALLMVITILAAITRLLTRYLTIGSLKVDDKLVFAIGQSITVIIQGAHGMGKIGGLGNDQISSILKAQYASDALYIIALLLGKMSATRTILDMAPSGKKRIIQATEVVIGVWAVSSLVTSLFQCSPPEPWDYLNGRCVNRSAFWIYVDILNILTDIAITAILFEIFIKLKTSTDKKILVICVFGCRVFIFPAIIFHIYYFKRAVDSTNPIFDMWHPTVLVQVIQCMSIMATCIPYLKPFLDSLESGQMNVGDLRGDRSKDGSSRSRSGYASGRTRTAQSRGNTARGITSVATMASNASHRRQKYEMFDLDNKFVDRRNGANVGTVTAACEAGGSWDGESRKSHNSQTVLVQQTVRVEVNNRDSSKAA